LPSVANALASRGMADAVGLMQWVRHVIGERGLPENPLGVRLGRRPKREEQEADQYFSVHDASSELEGHGQNRRSVRRSCYDGHGPVSFSDAMDFFALALLIESHRAQDGCQDHSWEMNPG
jgi:hypothetical protein